MAVPAPADIRQWVSERSLRRLFGWLVLTVLVLTILAAVGFYAYFGLLAHHAPADTHESVRANPNVTVAEGYGGYVVSDADPGGERLGIVFYPGGRVAPDAYLPTAARIADRANATVVVPKMRVNLAVLSQGRADAVRAGESQVDRWVVGGHSLGGAMACRYAAANPGAVDGLLLMGAYCDRPVRGMPALAVVGTRDAVLNRDRFAATRGNLPAQHTIVRIEGMNHSQAGAYRGQRGGHPARIETGEAHRRLAVAVDEWLCRDLTHCSRAAAD